MKIVIFLSTMILFSSCGEYFYLLPVSYDGDNKYEISDNDLKIIVEDSIIIRGDAIPKEEDSKVLYINIKLLVNSENNKWLDESIYSLFDADSLEFNPYNIKKFKNDDGQFEYTYRILFYDRNGIKLPIKFHFIDLKENQHFIKFILGRELG